MHARGIAHRDLKPVKLSIQKVICNNLLNIYVRNRIGECVVGEQDELRHQNCRLWSLEYRRRSSTNNQTIFVFLRFHETLQN